jgi:rfaE bifunctional protein nucleotidyltransferase chain/domain
MRKKVLTTGTYNLCHAGHIRLFEFCSSLGYLVVGINSDEYLIKKYGKEKTVQLKDRIYVLKACKFIDEVVVFDEDDPCNLISQIKPDVYVKGPDYKGVIIPEIDIIIKLGIRYIIQDAKKEYNSSNLLNTLIC